MSYASFTEFGMCERVSSRTLSLSVVCGAHTVVGDARRGVGPLHGFHSALFSRIAWKRRGRKRDAHLPRPHLACFAFKRLGQQVDDSIRVPHIVPKCAGQRVGRRRVMLMTDLGALPHRWKLVACNRPR